MAKQTYIYDVAEQHVLIEGDDEYHGGDEISLSDERAAELISLGINLQPKGGLKSLSRDELNARAETAGVLEPEKLSSKAAVADAIEQAEAESAAAHSTETQPAA